MAESAKEYCRICGKRGMARNREMAAQGHRYVCQKCGKAYGSLQALGGVWTTKYTKGTKREG